MKNKSIDKNEPYSDDISVIIVTFNNEKTIKKCLDSVFETCKNPELVIVDNNSRDRTKEIIRSFKRSVKLVESTDNLGFAKANNLAVSKSTKGYLLLLNPDTEILDKNSIEEMKNALDNNPEYGLIGPKLIYADGSDQLTVRNLPSLRRAFEEYLLWKKNSYNFYLPDCQTLCEVESVKGAVMFMKKKVFEQVGGFDERYFMYFEDLELCKSLRQIGLKIGYLPPVVFKHIEGISGKGQNTKELALCSAKIYHGPVEFYLIQIFGRINNKIRSII